METEVPPQVYNGMFVLDYNYPLIFLILLTIVSVYWLYQWKIDITPFLDSCFFSKSYLGNGDKKWLVSGDPQYIFSLVWISVFFFYWVNLSILYICFFCWFTPIFVSLVSFWHRPILVICEDGCSLKYHNWCWCMIKSYRSCTGSLLYIHFNPCFYPYLTVSSFDFVKYQAIICFTIQS